jgi:hypothetical protein
MGATGSCHDVRCVESKAHGSSSSGKIQGIAFDAFHEEEVCSRQPLPELKKADLDADDRECRLRFQLPPAAPFGLQLTEARCGSRGTSSSSALVVQHVTACSSLAKTIDGQPGIYAGDVIIEANGRRGTAAEVRDVLQQAVASSGTRDITLAVCRRPSIFDVEIPLDASKQKLGIVAVIDKAYPGCVLVQSVRSEGIVPEWNAAHASLQICAGDLITEVNSISNDASAMCLEMQNNPRGITSLQFRVAASKTSGKAHQTPDPRLVAPRSLIEAVDAGRPGSKKRCGLAHRRCADTERWQAELEAKSQRLRREVEKEFEHSTIASEPCVRHIILLDEVSSKKRTDTSGSDDEKISEVSTMCPTGSSTPSIDFL